MSDQNVISLVPLAAGQGEMVALPAIIIQVRAKKSEDRVNLATFLTDLAASGIDPFVNKDEEPRVALPGDTIRPDWDVQHRRVRAWLHQFFVQQYHVFPESAELKAAMDWLETLAYARGVQTEPTDGNSSVADDDPVLYAAYMHTKTLKVGETLTEVAQDGYNLMKYEAGKLFDQLDGFPARASDLSRRLGREVEALAEMGVTFAYGEETHTRLGNRWVWTRVNPAPDVFKPGAVASRSRKGRGGALPTREAGEPDLGGLIEGAERRRLNRP